jgi:hypothetical protein
VYSSSSYERWSKHVAVLLNSTAVVTEDACIVCLFVINTIGMTDIQNPRDGLVTDTW